MQRYIDEVSSGQPAKASTREADAQVRLRFGGSIVDQNRTNIYLESLRALFCTRFLHPPFAAAATHEDNSRCNVRRRQRQSRAGGLTKRGFRRPGMPEVYETFIIKLRHSQLTVGKCGRRNHIARQCRKDICKYGTEQRMGLDFRTGEHAEQLRNLRQFSIRETYQRERSLRKQRRMPQRRRRCGETTF